MIKIDPASYPDVLPLVEADERGAVYPLSVLQSKQAGDVFREGGAYLIWHCSGFAYLYGDCLGSFLERIYRGFLAPGSKAPRRLILFAFDPTVERFFREKEALAFGTRYFFSYQPQQADQSIIVPEPYELRPFDRELFDRVQGKVTPHLFWGSSEAFLRGGQGYCLLHDGQPASWAFSAAVSDRELDIGVETAPEHQHRGLALLVARRMIDYTLAQGKRPVWACAAGNEGSRRLALKLGFVKTAECTTIKAASL